MLYPLLSKYITFPLLGYILNGLYFGLIITGIVVSAFLFFRQMARTGYDVNRLRAFVVCSVIMIIPLGVISSRAANMFYFPPDQWSVSFFIEQFFSGPHQTFHAALILPFFFLMLLGQKFKFKKLHLIDSLFMVVPLGHAFGRCGCFLVGCCWGNLISFSLFNRTVSFHNPVPLYAIIFNLMLFLFLRKIYNQVYVLQNNKNQWLMSQGVITAFYLIGYGGFRIMMEFIRKETVVGMGMTMAQWSMVFFILCGMVFLSVTWYFNQYVEKNHP
jgi:prolipoprotein diacylglyceryltransferase